MATETMTMEGRQRKPKDANLPPENERFIRCCSDIASYLIQEFQDTESSKPKKDLNLNSLRTWWDGKTSISNICSFSRRQ
jgi:elongator complex protein 3